MTPELERAIGKVTLAYSSLDFILVSFAGQMVSPDQRIGQTLFGPMQMSRKVEMLLMLFELLPSTGCDDSPKALASLAAWDIKPVTKEHVAELKGLLNRARQAADRRNTIMHALTWIPQDSPNGPPIPTILKVKGSGLAAHPMPVSQVEELATEIMQIVHDLTQFMARQFRWDEAKPEGMFEGSLLGHGTLFESTVKGALSWFMKGPQPPKEQQ